jgi:hypothetical protein
VSAVVSGKHRLPANYFDSTTLLFIGTTGALWHTGRQVVVGESHRPVDVGECWAPGECWTQRDPALGAWIADCAVLVGDEVDLATWEPER